MATRNPQAVPAWPTDPLGDRPFGFVVTVKSVIGEVIVGEGDVGPHEAAFLLIARHDTEGDYEFPMANGGMCMVHVEHTEPEL